MRLPVVHSVVSVVGLVAFASAWGCATVGSPSGGPVDQTPPTLVATFPEDGATNVSDRTLRLAFSERLASGTAVRAVRVVPDGASPPRVRVRGDEIEIQFDSLRTETTYVVTIGTELADERNVKLTSPITVAFATGAQIDRGEIGGIVRDPQTGRGASGLQVLAYASSTPDLTTAPDYRSEVGNDGRFRLAYLRPDSFTVFALEDRNRNGLADVGERYAVPFTPVAQAVSPDDSTAQVPSLEMWVTALDTLPPQPRRVRPISDRRFAVRFDEAVQLQSLAPDAWVLTDSASATPTPVTVYQDPVQPAEVRFETARPLSPTVHQLELVATDVVADSAGTATQPFVLSFTPPERPDTLQARLTGFLPTATIAADSALSLRPDASFGLRFASPPDTAALAAQIELVDEEDNALAYAMALTSDGLGIEMLTAAPSPASFSLRFRQPDTTFARRYTRLGDADSGGLVGQVPGAAGRPVRVEAQLEDGTVLSSDLDADGAFAIRGLAPGSVRLRLFEDLDGDGRWSGGRLPPDAASPERLLIVPDPIQIRARWDTDVETTSLALFPDTP
ncbi:MAG: Ig-like domain-containing protein [Bacteroidota bacterium]